MKTGEKIRQARKNAKLTQKALGDKCGMPGSQIGLYESSRALPKTATLDRIAQALGVSTYNLMGEDYTVSTPRGEFNGDEFGNSLNQVISDLGRVFGEMTDLKRKLRIYLLENDDDLILPFKSEESKRMTRILSVVAGLNTDGLTAVEKIVDGLKEADAFNNHRSARVEDITYMMERTEEMEIIPLTRNQAATTYADVNHFMAFLHSSRLRLDLSEGSKEFIAFCGGKQNLEQFTRQYLDEQGLNDNHSVRLIDFNISLEPDIASFHLEIDGKKTILGHYDKEKDHFTYDEII